MRDMPVLQAVALVAYEGSQTSLCALLSAVLLVGLGLNGSEFGR